MGIKYTFVPFSWNVFNTMWKTAQKHIFRLGSWVRGLSMQAKTFSDSTELCMRYDSTLSWVAVGFMSRWKEKSVYQSAHILEVESYHNLGQLLGTFFFFSPHHSCCFSQHFAPLCTSALRSPRELFSCACW